MFRLCYKPDDSMCFYFQAFKMCADVAEFVYAIPTVLWNTINCNV